MHNSTPTIAHDTRRRLAGGYVPFYDDRPWRPEHGLVPARWIESAEADGCQCCTAEDLARYLRALWNNGEGLLPPATATLMRTALPPHEDDDGGYGYGLVVEAHGFGHAGDTIGYVSHMWADDASGYGVVAFANGIHGAFALAEAALAIARGGAPDLGRSSPNRSSTTVRAQSSGGPYLGRYRCHNPWRPSFQIAARAAEMVLGTDWMDSERLSLTPVGPRAPGPGQTSLRLVEE